MRRTPWLRNLRSRSERLVVVCASRGFAGVDYLKAWPRSREAHAAYDIVVSGRLLEDGVAKLSSTFGLSLIGIPYLALLGTPNWSSERSLEFEVSAARTSGPAEPLLSKRIRL